MIGRVAIAAVRLELDQLGIEPSRFSLRGGRPGQGYAIKREGMGWIVYYSERGGRSDIEKFSTEDAASRRLLSLLMFGAAAGCLDDEG